MVPILLLYKGTSIDFGNAYFLKELKCHWQKQKFIAFPDDFCQVFNSNHNNDCMAKCWSEKSGLGWSQRSAGESPYLQISIRLNHANNRLFSYEVFTTNNHSHFWEPWPTIHSYASLLPPKRINQVLRAYCPSSFSGCSFNFLAVPRLRRWQWRRGKDFNTYVALLFLTCTQSAS